MRLRHALLAACLLLSLTSAQNAPRGEAGRFDYYILALSWSPSYCDSLGNVRNDPQCAPGRRLAFILHGLWPQYDSGDWPQFCSAEPGLPDPARMLDIMPSPALVRHEWDRHGSCSGLKPQEYFALARRAFQSLRIPPRFHSLEKPLVVSPQEIRRGFLDANPSLPPQSVIVRCSSRSLSEVRVCLDRGLRPRACTNIAECREPEVRMLPNR